MCGGCRAYRRTFSGVWNCRVLFNTFLWVHCVTVSEGHRLNTPNLKCVSVPCQDTVEHSNQCISSAPLPSTLVRWHSRAAPNLSQWWMGLVAQAGGMMNSNQWTPLGLLSMGYFLKHLLPGYPSSDKQRGRHKEWRSQPWGLWQSADTFWGFHHHILSLHDQIDSRTCWCSLTRTVFSTCNKSLISSDDRRLHWWISVKVPQVDSPSTLMRSLWSRGAVPVKQTSSIKVKCIVALDKKRQKSNLKYEEWRNSVVSFCMGEVPFVQWIQCSE